MFRSMKIVICCFVISVYGSVVHAERGDPVYIGNQNPWVLIFGLPKAESGNLTEDGILDTSFTYFITNHAISDDSGDESIIWDGETTQYNFAFRYGFSDTVELGLDIPYVHHGGGYMDSMIRNYHDIFGMPNDRQEAFDKNQIHYQIQENEVILFQMQDSASGIGDVRLSAAMPLMIDSLGEKRHLALRSQIKLPTGDAKYLLGSGATDVSIGLTYSDFETLNNFDMVLSSHAGVIYLGDADVLTNKQENIAVYGGISIDWLALENLEIKAQLDMHTALYDSDLVQLGSSIQLLVGGTLYLPGDMLLDLGISEQLSTDATPDVGFYLHLQHVF